MIDEINKVASGEEPVGNEQYIAAINELKENTVSKDKYQKLQEENKQLLSSLVNGTGVAVEQNPVAKESIADLSEHLKTSGISNLDYVTTALKLRERCLEEEGRDTFVPVGTQYTPSQEDINTAQRVAEGLQEIVDMSEGSPEVFNGLYQRYIRDAVVPGMKRK